MREDILRILSLELRNVLRDVGSNVTVNEIRLRSNKPMLVLAENREYYVANHKLVQVKDQEEQKCQEEHKEIYIVREKDIKETLELITNYSLYAYEEEVRQGYITVMGGHRIGICGRVVYENGVIKTIRNIQSLNIRVAHEIIGCGNDIFRQLYHQRGFDNTLIFSSPGMGKTTLLRDLVRLLSDGDDKTQGQTIGLVDERSEIAACHFGKPQNLIGLRTDVMDCCQKKDGMMMLVRSMHPDIVAVDEIGSKEDVQSIEYCSLCGCKVLATIHAGSLEELRNKKEINELLEQGVFRYLIQCENFGGKLSYSIIR